MTRHSLVPPLILGALIPGCSPTRALYHSEIREERLAHPPNSAAVLGEAELAGLPDPVRRYLELTGWVGRELPLNADIEWLESAIRLGPDRGWMRLQTNQFNSVPEPMRAAYMRGRMLGILPMEGLDLYRDGRGRMLIRLVRYLTVSHDTGPEMDQSALVTILAEALFVPGYAVQPYITWVPMGARSARATIRHGGTEASGVFHFDADGLFTRFETEDRYYATRGGARKVRWSAEVLDHVDRSGVRIVGGLRAVWHLEEGDFEYFRGRIGAIRFNVDG
jgi:hypothetical protein